MPFNYQIDDVSSNDQYSNYESNKEMSSTTTTNTNSNNNNVCNGTSSSTSKTNPILMNLIIDFFNSQLELKRNVQCLSPNINTNSNMTTSTMSTSTKFPSLAALNNKQKYQKVKQALILLGRSFQSQFEQQLFDSLKKLDLQKQNCHTTFYFLSNEMFVSGIQWHFIITYFTFSVEFALYCSQQGFANVSDVALWLCKYTEQYILPWIEQQSDGWDGLVKFAQDHSNESILDETDRANQNSTFKFDFKNILCGAAGAIGAISFGLFMSSK